MWKAFLAVKSPPFILKWGGKATRPLHVQEVKVFHSLRQVCGLQKACIACIGLRCAFETTSGQFSPIQGEKFHLGTTSFFWRVWRIECCTETVWDPSIEVWKCFSFCLTPHNYGYGILSHGKAVLAKMWYFDLKTAITLSVLEISTSKFIQFVSLYVVYTMVPYLIWLSLNMAKLSHLQDILYIWVF